jgi:hypothetical protein
MMKLTIEMLLDKSKNRDTRFIGCRLSLNSPEVVVTVSAFRSFEENLAACLRGAEAAWLETISVDSLEDVKVESFRSY